MGVLVWTKKCDDENVISLKNDYFFKIQKDIVIN